MPTFTWVQSNRRFPYLPSPVAVTVGSLCPGGVSLAGCVRGVRLHSSLLQDYSGLLVLPLAHTTSLFHQSLIHEIPHPKIQHPRPPPPPLFFPGSSSSFSSRFLLSSCLTAQSSSMKASQFSNKPFRRQDDGEVCFCLFLSSRNKKRL